jgi:hypothetical protein
MKIILQSVVVPLLVALVAIALYHFFVVEGAGKQATVVDTLGSVAFEEGVPGEGGSQPEASDEPEGMADTSDLVVNEDMTFVDAKHQELHEALMPLLDEAQTYVRRDVAVPKELEDRIASLTKQIDEHFAAVGVLR